MKRKILKSLEHKVKNEYLWFTFLLNGHIKHELHVCDKGCGNVIDGHRRGNFRVKEFLKE